MKRLLTLLIFAISLQTYAQLPDAFNYQATIRAESGDLLVNTNVNFKVTIYEGQGVGNTYVESHFVPTDDLGHVNFVVGYGEPLEGSMAEIDWSMGNYWMKVELDTGQGYVDMGDTQLLSVPYALYALESGGETGDLQSVLDAGSNAEIVMSDNNLEGLKVMSSGGDNPDRNYNGIQSIISGTDGRNIALSGISNGDNAFRNYGVWGTAMGSSGINGAVLGTANSDVGENRGVWSIAAGNTDGYNYGVTGVANNSASVNIAGGFYAEGGEVEAQQSYGVSARSSVTSSQGTNYGVFANAYGALNNYGIYATAPPASDEGSQNFAGYFAGDVYVDQSGHLKAENQPVADNDVVNKAYLESVLQAYDDRLAALEEVVETLQESGSLLVDQDGNILLTEEYGEDIWATENVKVVTYRDGTPIPYVANLNDQFDTSIGHWTYANGDPSTGEILYNRQAIMGIWDADSAGDPSQRKELAPEGWHVATNEDWNSLIEYMTNTYGVNFAKEMASTQGWIDGNIDDTPGTASEENNASGFNLKPSGYGLAGGETYSFGEFSVVWGEYDESTFLGKYFFMAYNQNFTGLFDIDSQDFFFSARFVKGEAEDNNVINLPNNLGLVGSAINDWGNAGPDTPLTYLGNGQYEVNVTFTDGEFKFREDNNWSVNYGDNGADGTLDLGGDNIAVTAGDYLVSVNWLDMTYTLQQNGYCGDGIVSAELGEECDDGNNDPNDGCDGCMIVEIDNDGDGFSIAQGDCDDNNANVNPGVVEVCDQIDNNCNGTVDELDQNTFIGEYIATYNGEGIAAAVNYGVFGESTTVFLDITGNNERSFTVPSIYPGLGGFNGISVNLVFNCNGSVSLADDTDIGVGCGNGNIILSPSQFGSYNPIDDSSFTIQFQEDSESSCGAPGTTVYTFTKVN